MAAADYSQYIEYVKSICAKGDLSRFKSHPAYTPILEHCTYEQGLGYWNELQTVKMLSTDHLKIFCDLNDAVGNPTRFTYGIDNCVASPTSLRYIYHAHLILTHFKHVADELENASKGLSLVEIGGGYGGLALAMFVFAPLYGVNIQKYAIIDIAAVSELQKLYLSRFQIAAQLEFVDAATFGAGVETGGHGRPGHYLISNYAFSEIAPQLQAEYVKHLFPKVVHGFMAWNWIPVYDFGFNVRNEPEVPNTGGQYNRYLYF